MASTTESPTNTNTTQAPQNTQQDDSTPTHPLTTLRIPGYPDTPLHLAGLPLNLLTTPLPPSPLQTRLPVPTALATVLYNWHPNALLALLDIDAWFSLTWTLTLPTCVLEIGRVAQQITFGRLDASGDAWELMLSYRIASTGDWIPLERESMRGDANLSAPEIDDLASSFLEEMIRNERWKIPAGVKARHAFAIEYAPMDPFSDGIPMSPHWLYAPLDLDVCTTCGVPAKEGQKLHRCARCGMAAYCGAECQRKDWAVHKALCGMGAVERGTAVRISMDGGLVAWDVERRFGESEEESENPHFGDKVMKRTRAGNRLASLVA